MIHDEYIHSIEVYYYHQIFGIFIFFFWQTCQIVFLKMKKKTTKIKKNKPDNIIGNVTTKKYFYSGTHFQLLNEMIFWVIQYLIFSIFCL